jgi:hypothetical protein
LELGESIRHAGVTAASTRNFETPTDIGKPLTTPSGIRDPRAASEMLDMAAEAVEKPPSPAAISTARPRESLVGKQIQGPDQRIARLFS